MKKLIRQLQSRISMKEKSVFSGNVKVWVDKFGQSWIAKSRLSFRKKAEYILDKKHPWLTKPSKTNPLEVAHYLISEFRHQSDSENRYIGCNIEYSKRRINNIVDFIYAETNNDFWNAVKFELDRDGNYKQFIKWNYLYKSLKEELKTLDGYKGYYVGQDVEFGRLRATILNKIEYARAMFEFTREPWQTDLED